MFERCQQRSCRYAKKTPVASNGGWNHFKDRSDENVNEVEIGRDIEIANRCGNQVTILCDGVVVGEVVIAKRTTELDGIHSGLEVENLSEANAFVEDLIGRTENEEVFTDATSELIEIIGAEVSTNAIDHVVAFATEEAVVANATDEVVSTCIAIDLVGACTTREDVCTTAAVEDVVSILTIDDVGTIVTTEGVGDVSTHHIVEVEDFEGDWINRRLVDVHCQRIGSKINIKRGGRSTGNFAIDGVDLSCISNDPLNVREVVFTKTAEDSTLTDEASCSESHACTNTGVVDGVGTTRSVEDVVACAATKDVVVVVAFDGLACSCSCG